MAIPVEDVTCIEDWKSLDTDHKAFVLRVLKTGEYKHSADPCSIPSTVRHDPPWAITEELGFVKFTGIHKFKVTPKFERVLELLLEL